MVMGTSQCMSHAHNSLCLWIVRHGEKQQHVQEVPEPLLGRSDTLPQISLARLKALPNMEVSVMWEAL